MVEGESLVESGDVFLEGERIVLRALSTDDISSWYAWFNSGKVTENINKGVFPNSRESQADYLRALSKSQTDLQLAITLKEGSELIGVIGIHKIDWLHRRGDISIVIGNEKAWGRGLATEAIEMMVRHGFEKLNLHKITAGMWATNEGSRRSFEKNGFVLEGTLKENYFFKTSYVDEYRLGIIRKDWESSRKGMSE